MIIAEGLLVGLLLFVGLMLLLAAGSLIAMAVSRLLDVIEEKFNIEQEILVGALGLLGFCLIVGIGIRACSSIEPNVKTQAEEVKQ